VVVVVPASVPEPAPVPEFEDVSLGPVDVDAPPSSDGTTLGPQPTPSTPAIDTIKRARSSSIPMHQPTTRLDLPVGRV